MGKIFDALEKFESETAAPDLKRGKAVNSEPVPRKSEKRVIQKTRHRFNNRPDRNLVTLNDPLGFESEQFKILRTKLLFPKSGKRARTIMVTSALPGEGKSFVASNLAVSLAQNINEHVLLIDSDIRKPALHTVFGFGHVFGLTEHLSNNTPLENLLLKTMVNKLSLLPGGAPPHNPSELLSSESMSSLIREVKARYNDRYVIFDTSPPTLTAESSALARQVDGIVVVVNSESTPKADVEKLVEVLDRDKILGVVMNRFETHGSKYYGYKNNDD